LFTTLPHLSRRRILQLAGSSLLGGSAPRAAAQVQPPAGKRPKSVPQHLPDRLAICYYGWDWITSARSDEPFGNLERALIQTKERGFNCVRAEAGLNWMYDPEGKRRGKLKFREWIPGASFNLHCVDAKGGEVHDVFERVMRLFELADKHGLYVILTSWEYQDAVAHTDDRRVRDQIVGVAYNDRLMLLARHFDRLLREIKRRGLDKRIASVEVINELNVPPIVCSEPGVPKQTFEEWTRSKVPGARCTTDQVRTLAHNAVAHLKERHADLLVTIDGLVATKGFSTLFPENAQIADHHVYSDGVVQAFWREAGIAGLAPDRPQSGDANPFLRSVMKPKGITWEEIVRRGAGVRQTWLPVAWLYSNIDNEKFDRWCVSKYPEYRQKIRDSIDHQFQAAATFAASRNLPLVVDEGFILYPPLHARFVTTPEGREGEEMGVNAAIATGHWGVMISGYFRPNTPFWMDDSQSDWARRVNRRILETKTHTMGA
jgi:hypothetical protein